MASLNDRRCNFEVVVVQTDWAECFDNSRPGEGLKRGDFHACMTYTHTQGIRPRMLEFSNAILKMNKPAGILTRLENGKPVIDPKSNLDGVKIADVKGWAPTKDSIDFVANNCTGESFVNYEMIIPDDSYTRDAGGDPLTNANDIAVAMLLDSKVDAVWIYADQAYNYDCEGLEGNEGWDCDIWGGFGTTFGYIHTGMDEHARNGTTLTMSKKGSGIADLINPCIDKYMKTIQYKRLCDEHDISDYCYENQFFEVSETDVLKEKGPYMLDTSEHEGTGCTDGYCTCSSFE